MSISISVLLVWKHGNIHTYIHNTIHMYSGITSGRVLDGELLYTKILEVNLFAFAYRLFHSDFSPINVVYMHTYIHIHTCIHTYKHN